MIRSTKSANQAPPPKAKKAENIPKENRMLLIKTNGQTSVERPSNAQITNGSTESRTTHSVSSSDLDSAEHSKNNKLLRFGATQKNIAPTNRPLKIARTNNMHRSAKATVRLSRDRIKCMIPYFLNINHYEYRTRQTDDVQLTKSYCITLHEYYTPKTTKFQLNLVNITFFVNYADFYVNIIMLTKATVITQPLYHFQLFDNILPFSKHFNTKYSF